MVPLSDRTPQDKLAKTDGTFTRLSEAHGGQLPTSIPLLHNQLHDSAREHADKIAIISKHQSNALYDDSRTAKGCLRWSYGPLESILICMSDALTGKGVKKGMPIATFMPLGIELILIAWAVIRLGCPFVPMSPGSLSNKDDVCHMLKTAGVKVVVVDGLEVRQSISSILNELRHETTLRIVASRTPQGPESEWVSLDHLLSTKDARRSDLPSLLNRILVTLSSPVGVRHVQKAVSTPTNHAAPKLSLKLMPLVSAGMIASLLLCRRITPYPSGSPWRFW